MTNLFRHSSRYGLAAVLVLSLAALQTSGIFSFFGIVPNLALGALVALLFYFGSFAEVLLLAALAAAALNWTHGIPWELAAFLGAVSAAFILKKVTPWHFVVEAALVSGAAALVFALLADPAYPFLFPGRFGVELLYTVGSAFFVLGLFTLWYGPPQETARA